MAAFQVSNYFKATVEILVVLDHGINSKTKSKFQLEIISKLTTSFSTKFVITFFQSDPALLKKKYRSSKR